MKIFKFLEKIQKITYIFCVLQISIICTMNIISYATVGDEYLQNVTNDVDNWTKMGQEQMDNIGIDMNDLLKPVLGIAQILTFVGFVASIMGTLYIAIKWLLNANKSPDELQKVKHQTFGLLVAAIVCLGAYNIWKLLIQSLGEIT